MTSSRDGASACPLPRGVVRGLRPLSSQPHHGWKMLRLFWPRQQFPRGSWHHDQKTASLLSNVVLATGSNKSKPALEAQMIPMVDFTSTQAHAKEVAPPTSREGGQAKAAVAKPPSASPPLTTDEVDKMYCQLAEIHTIATVQLAECAHWLRSDSTPGPVWAETSQSTPIMMPSTIKLVPSPPTDFSPQALLWWQGRHGGPQACCKAR
jgi:hypothetical protein